MPLILGAQSVCVSLLHLELPPLANGTVTSAANGNAPKPNLIPNGMPSTVVPCGTERCLPNGIPNGHVTPMQDSPFIGYIIAMHRKMVRTVKAFRRCLSLKWIVHKVSCLTGIKLFLFFNSFFFP